MTLLTGAVCIGVLECGVPPETKIAAVGVAAVIASAIIRFVPVPWGGER